MPKPQSNHREEASDSEEEFLQIVEESSEETTDELVENESVVFAFTISDLSKIPNNRRVSNYFFDIYQENVAKAFPNKEILTEVVDNNIPKRKVSLTIDQKTRSLCQ